MARKASVKGSDKDQTTPQDNETPETPVKTPNTGKSDPDKANDPDTGDLNTEYIDSDSQDIAASLTKILNVPTETIQNVEQAEEKSEVLSGFDIPDQNEPVQPRGGGSGEFNEESQGGFNDFADSGSDDSGLFEDNELLAQIGVELIDMLMTYGAMAIAKDWDNEEKYSIKDKRKKKLEAPLQKILESREVKTAPELVFAFMLVVSYSPVMIDAVQTRRAKKEASQAGAVKSSPGVVKPAPVKIAERDPYADLVEPKRSEDVETPSDEVDMAEMMANFKPKAKPGRPVGATDMKARESLSEDERERRIQRAKALRKDGKSFTSIAKDLNVSVATATRWVRS